MRFLLEGFKRAARLAGLLALVTFGTLLLTRFAPGYFTDAREMDVQLAHSARGELALRREAEGSVFRMAQTLLHAWAHGSLGMSRQYDVPVAELILPRLRATLSLVGRAMLSGFLCALALALPLSARRSGRGAQVVIGIASAVLLSIPIGALGTLCILSNTGGPALAIAVLAGSRDFAFLYRLLRRGWREPHLLYARAQGLSAARITVSHLAPSLAPQLFALATMSFVLALGAVIPAEVIFDAPGLGQLAWSAAMNRDLPVLLSITLLMAGAVGVAGSLTGTVLNRTRIAEAA